MKYTAYEKWPKPLVVLDPRRCGGECVLGDFSGTIRPSKTDHGFALSVLATREDESSQISAPIRPQNKDGAPRCTAIATRPRRRAPAKRTAESTATRDLLRKLSEQSRRRQTKPRDQLPCIAQGYPDTAAKQIATAPPTPEQWPSKKKTKTKCSPPACRPAETMTDRWRQSDIIPLRGHGSRMSAETPNYHCG